MNANIAMPSGVNSSKSSFKASSFSNGSDEAKFVGLLTGLIASGSPGEEALVSLLNSNQNLNQDFNLSQNQTLTIGTLLKELNIREFKGDSSNKGETLNNFILDENLEDVLGNLKNLTKAQDDNITQFLVDGNIDISFAKMRSINSLNSLAQNSNISSTISGMISNISPKGENKEIIDALKFLQQFTSKDGSLDTAKLIKSIESKGDAGLMNNMTFTGTSSGVQDTTNIKYANIFKSGDIVDVVVESFKTLRLPGRCEMRIKLNPQELGEITIKLVLEKGQVSASISADKKETFAMLQNNIQSLQEKLQSSGVDLHHVSVNLSQEDGGEQARRGYNRNEEEKSEDEFESIFEDVLDERV
ncbi:MAG: flagellar hook-length control protein FliK [Clostridium sp.]